MHTYRIPKKSYFFYTRGSPPATAGQRPLPLPPAPPRRTYRGNGEVAATAHFRSSADYVDTSRGRPSPLGVDTSASDPADRHCGQCTLYRHVAFSLNAENVFAGKFGE